MRENARYRMTRLLELTRRCLLQWNMVEVGDIFRLLKVVEGSISEFREWEEQQGNLSWHDLSKLHHQLSKHHSLLR